MSKLTRKQQTAIFQAMCQYSLYSLYRDEFRKCDTQKDEHRCMTVQLLVAAGFTREQVADITGLREIYKIGV